MGTNAEEFYDLMKYALNCLGLNFHEKGKMSFKIDGHYITFQNNETQEAIKLKVDLPQ